MEGKISYEKLDKTTNEKLKQLYNGTTKKFMMTKPANIIVPKTYKEIGQKIIDFDMQQNDVFIFSLPRVGSTMTCEMSWLLMNDLDYNGARKEIVYKVPFLEFIGMEDYLFTIKFPFRRWFYPDAFSAKSPKICRSHMPKELLPKKLDTVKPKIIYISRDPKDNFTSNYYLNKLETNSTMSYEEQAEIYLNGQCFFGNPWEHILTFWNKRNDPNVLFLKYDDIKKNRGGVVRNVAEFFEKKYSEEQLDVLTDYLSFERMKNNPAVNEESFFTIKRLLGYSDRNKDNAFIRKGIIGDYKNIMSPELQQRFDQLTKKYLNSAGLYFADE